MSTFIIGDIHGCFATFERLLEELEYGRSRDRLWLTGDLVNRGPRSLDVVRWARDNEDHVVTVLGNHDLHLVACSYGIRQKKSKDTFDDVLNAADSEELVAWLVDRPVIHREGDLTLVHAGIIPEWSIHEAASIAAEVQRRLSEDPTELLRGMYASGRDHFASIEDPEVALQAALRVFVSIRTCTPSGRLCTDFAGPPQDAPDGCVPWFGLRERVGTEHVVFGHWAALGLHLGDGFTGLDTGCAWGGALTALRLEDRQVFEVPRVD